MKLDTPADPLAGQGTLIDSWDALAATSPGARLERRSATLGAVFPEYGALNNAILLDPVSSGAASAAADDLREWYGVAGVTSWALWLPSRSTSFAAADVVTEVDGMVRDTTTLVMTASLQRGGRRDHRVMRTSVDAAGRAGDEPVPAAELPGPDGAARMDAWVLVDRNAERNVDRDVAVAAAWSIIHDTDCGVYAVGTVPGWRRRGLAAALMRHLLADAWDRGARTATLQSTAMGEPLYRSLGFEAVGRYEEWVPGSPS